MLFARNVRITVVAHAPNLQRTLRRCCRSTVPEGGRRSSSSIRLGARPNIGDGTSFTPPVEALQSSPTFLYSRSDIVRETSRERDWGWAGHRFPTVKAQTQ